MATFGPPFVNTQNLADGAVTSAKIALDTIAAVDVATNAIGDAEVAAHTTTKITSPFSLVTGTVPLNQGGTGQTTLTPAFDALAPTTTQGDVIYHNGTDNVRLGPGTTGQFLKTQGAGANPIWDTVSAQPAYSLIETLTWSANSANQSFATFAAFDELMLKISGTVVQNLNLTVNTGNANTYDHTLISNTAVATSLDQASWILLSGATDTNPYSATYYLHGKTGATRTGIHGTGYLLREQATSRMFSGDVDVSGSVTAITIMVNAVAVTMKAKLYGLNF